MSIIKRLSTTLMSRIDQVVGEIENHDALAEAALGEQKKKIAAAKVQLARVQSQEQRLQSQISQLKEEAHRWEKRAVQAAARDESRALECLQRRKQIESQVERLTAAQDEYAASVARIGADIGRAENDLLTLTQKHTLLRARQTSNEAIHAPFGAGIAKLDELESTFERWETRIAQDEILNEMSEPFDPLEQSYRNDEEAEALRDELQSLLSREKGDE